MNHPNRSNTNGPMWTSLGILGALAIPVVGIVILRFLMSGPGPMTISNLKSIPKPTSVLAPFFYRFFTNLHSETGRLEPQNH